MKAEEKTPPHIAKLTTVFRFVGWWFLILGSIMSVWPIAILFDSEAAMPVNGVPHKDILTKLGVAALVLIATAIGAVLALTPRKKLEAALAAFDRFAHEFAASQLRR